MSNLNEIKLIFRRQIRMKSSVISGTRTVRRKEEAYGIRYATRVCLVLLFSSRNFPRLSPADRTVPPAPDRTSQHFNFNFNWIERLDGHVGSAPPIVGRWISEKKIQIEWKWKGQSQVTWRDHRPDNEGGSSLSLTVPCVMCVWWMSFGCRSVFFRQLYLAAR